MLLPPNSALCDAVFCGETNTPNAETPLTFENDGIRPLRRDFFLPQTGHILGSYTSRFSLFSGK
jgi:hypothetical protein